MADEPRMSVLSSSTLRSDHSATNRRRGGGALGTDFSAACAPDSPASFVLVLRLPSGSPIPCGVLVGKGDLFGWALLAQASTLSSFRPCGTCPPLLQKPSASLFQALALLHVSGVSLPRTYLVAVCYVNTLSLRRGRVAHPEDARVSFTSEDQDSGMGPLVRDCI